MAVTLADLLRIEQKPLKKFILANLLRYSDLMSLVPFDSVDQLSSTVVRWKTLPSVAFRQINGSTAESSGTTEQVTEGVYALGGDVKFDKVFEMVKDTIVDPKKLQTQMKVKAIAYKFNDYFINGDHASDVNGFEGLNKRIASYLPSRQSIATKTTAFDATASAANEQHVIDKFHELIDLAGLRKAPMVKVGGTPSNAQPARSGAILMNRDMYLGFGKILRRAGVLMTTQDAYGREFDSFAGVPLIDVGLKDDQSTEIITNAYGGSTNETRVFAVRFGSDDGLTGIQMNAPEPYDPLNGAELSTGPQKLLRIDWFTGLAGYGSFYAARLTGVKDPTQWT